MTRDDVSGIFIRYFFFQKSEMMKVKYIIKDINKRSNKKALQGIKGKLGGKKTDQEREREKMIGASRC